MLDEIVPLNPVHFFAFQIDSCFVKGNQLEKKHRLPDLSPFHLERPFAQVALGWNAKGILAEVRVRGSFDEPDFPNFVNADSIEFFFDTRDVKTTGYNTRFCHHFYFLPEPVSSNGDRVQAGEVTRFRTEDVHELCDATLLKVQSKQEKKQCVIHIFIPSECLYGYDPTQFDRLGFTYRINRVTGEKQQFSVNDEDFTIENQPSLWASLKLVEKR